jgi:nitroreductase
MVGMTPGGARRPSRSPKGPAVVETWDALTSRRNVRSYTAEPIPDASLDRILEAARRTPSASNRQHWDLVVVTDRAQLVELSTVWRGAGHVAGSAATIALVAPEPPDDRTRVVDQYDLGQLSFAIAVVAADLGIGSGHSSVGDEDRARRILGVPEGYVVSWLIALGFPADRPLAPVAVPARRPLEDVVHRGRW